MDIDFILFLKQFVLNCDDYDLFSTCFEFPAKEAADKLGLHISSFKKRCRKCGIDRWPSRQIKSLKTLATSVVGQDVKKIEDVIKKFKRNPNAKVPPRIRKLMAMSYKQKHAAKRK